MRKGIVVRELETTKPRVVGPIGYCIYCGAKPPHAVLSKEHVLPSGLGGGLVLLAASCETCRLITHKFETTCLRGSFLGFRVKAGFQKPTNKERPTHLPIRADPGVPGSRKMVALDDFPLWLHMPRFPEPAFFSGRPHGLATLAVRMESFGNPAKLDEIAARHGGTLTEDVTFPLHEFLQMLAKIAHGVAWDEVGPANFRPFLTDLIRGIDLDTGYYIGETTKPVEDVFPEGKGKMHTVVQSILDWNGRNLLCYRLRLFAHFNAPTYYIVVGEMTPTAEWLAQRGLRLEGSKIVVAPQ